MKETPAARAPLEGDREADLLVIGAGLTGCAAAREAARRGQRVLVLESATVGSGAETLGHIPTGLEVSYREAIDRFGREQARELWSLHREGHERVREALEEMASDCGYASRGGFRLATGRAEGEALAESEDLLREDGFSGEFFDQYMLEARFDVAGFAAGYWAADDGEIDWAAFVKAMAAAAEAEGTRIHEASAVVALELSKLGAEAATAGGQVRAARVLVTDGAQAPRLLPSVGKSLSIVQGQGAEVGIEHGVSVPSPALARAAHAYWRATNNGLRVESFDEAASLEEFLAFHFPRALSTVLSRFSTKRVESADGLPLVGCLPDLPTVVACGYGGVGNAYALPAARWAAEAILTGRDPTPAMFRAARRLNTGEA